MEEKPQEAEDGGGGEGAWVELELPLGGAAATFDLERAVCSHGLFMMAPNRWDPLSKTLIRPLRLSLSSLPPGDGDDASVLVRISHPPQNPGSLRIVVCGNRSLSSQQHHRAILGQVGRMLHLSEADEGIVRGFQEMMQRGGIGQEGDQRSFNGRAFRSPTLFEDMVKCILLCNCQWPRTLSMAKALCELQLELHLQLSSSSAPAADGSNSTSLKAVPENFVPKTPLMKESRRKTGVCKITRHSAITSKCADTNEELEAGVRDFHLHNKIGNFPSPKELASLDERFLAKRCGLGYRAHRILNLAQGVVEGKIHFEQLEEVSGGASLLKYNELAEQLKQIDGFGPFTCANVLVCMGFYHVIPTDSETIRHIKQVHSRTSTARTVERDVEDIYGKYAPFQFLAYWSEVWHFYEKRFGNLCEMPHSDYGLITATNMRAKGGPKCKRVKRNVEEHSSIILNDMTDENLMEPYAWVKHKRHLEISQLHYLKGKRCWESDIQVRAWLPGRLSRTVSTEERSFKAKSGF